MVAGLEHRARLCNTQTEIKPSKTVTRLRNSHMANFQKADAFQMAGITFASGSRHFHERSDPETGRWRAKLFVTALSRFKGRYATGAWVIIIIVTEPNSDRRT
jgi:hypothetical protein